jgi:hypothetical protein
MSITAVIWMTKQKTGDSASKSLLFWLAWHLNDETGLCYPSLTTLQSEMEVGSINTVRSAIERLSKAGLITAINERSTGGKIVKTCYRLNGFNPSTSDMSTIDVSTVDISTIDRSNIDISNADISTIDRVISTIDTNNKDIRKDTTNADVAKASSARPQSSPVGGASKTMLLSEAVQDLPDAWRQYAQKVRADLDPDIVFANFTYYWTSGRGAGKRRSVRGWASSWQTWVRNEKGIQSAPQSSSAPLMNGYSKIRRTPEEEAKAVAMAKEYWERREAEAQKQASSDPFDRAMKKDREKEAEKQIETALGGLGMIHSVRGRY